MGQLFYYITVPFGYLMKFCCFISPGNNYLVALIFFTIIVQVLLCLIFGIKQQKNMRKQASLAPKLAAIRKKYAGRNDQKTRQQMQQEIMAFQQENGYSPLGGCLPMLIQLPIIMVLYNVIISPLRYMYMMAEDTINEMIKALYTAGNFFTGATTEKIAAAFEQNKLVSQTADFRSIQYEILGNVSGYDASALTGAAKSAVTTLQHTTIPSYKIGPIDFSMNPQYPTSDSFSSLWPLIFIPVLIVVTMILSTMITRKFTYQDPATADQQNGCSMKAMMYSMPLLSAWISFSLPAAVGVYWIYRSIAATLQQIIMSKLMPMPKFTEEDYKAAEKELLGSNNKKKKTNNTPYTGEKKRSLHHIDDEEDETTSAPALEKKADKETEEKAEEPAKLNGAPLDEDAPVIKDDKNTHYKKK